MRRFALLSLLGLTAVGKAHVRKALIRDRSSEPRKGAVERGPMVE